MPVTANAAFGRYLRLLREDRGFTLRHVCELSERSTPIDKATLSRLERGRQGATPAGLVFSLEQALGPQCHPFRVMTSGG